MTTESQQQLDVPQLVLEAIERCQDHLPFTPLEHSLYLSEKIEGEVWLKLASMQRTSSFKFRGAINKILSLTEAGALGVGGLLKRKERFKGKKVVAAVCGRNIDLEVFKRIIQRR